MPAAQLKSMRQEISDVLSEAQVMAFVQVIRRHDDATLDDLFKLAKEFKLEHLSLGDLLVDDLPKSGKDWSKRTPRAMPSAVEVRTAKGRAAYDANVLTVLSKRNKYVSAASILGETRGTADQLRTSLNRLIQRGKVLYSGRARGTKYKVK